MEENSLPAHTCITCRVAFRDLEIQRQHYKSDWHRYNLKRKVAELPPVAVDEFQKRVIAQRGADDIKANGEGEIKCEVCKKSFRTKNQLENHESSKKHKEKVVSCEESEEKRETEEKIPKAKPGKETLSDERMNVDVEEDSDVETVDSDEWGEENPAENNDCLFCSNHSRSFIRNLKHMTLAHSFFIPDTEYCTDPRGLILYLGEKIFCGFMCIWCNETGKAFKSAEAARAHMLDKSHCKMLHEGEALVEYADYYDYSSSYPDPESADPDTDLPDIPEIDDSDYQLVLPSGNVVGHRSLFRYYKQSFDPNRAPPIRDKVRKVLYQYRALGCANTDINTVKKKARDINYMLRIQAKYRTKMQFKANKFQPHFRQQVNF